MDTSIKIQPLLVNQKKAAEMLGVSVRTFVKLGTEDYRLMSCVIPGTTAKRYLVSDLEEYARSLKYPNAKNGNLGGIWDDESCEMWANED